MMELSIAVCDDLPEERASLARMLRACCQERGLRSRLTLFSSGDELLEAFHPNRFHILLLDIYMDGLSGMHTARRIRKLDRSCSIVFATTSQSHGMESFEVQASDYLVKPFSQQEVGDALDRCLEQQRERLRCLQVLSGWTQREIPLQTLEYIEIRGHQAQLHAGEQVVVARRGLDELETEIGSADFLRCHRSFLVNMNYIRRMEGGCFQMASGAVVPIGSTGAARVREQFMDWAFLKGTGRW